MGFFKKNRVLIVIIASVGFIISESHILAAGFFIAAGLFAVADALESKK